MLEARGGGRAACDIVGATTPRILGGTTAAVAGDTTSVVAGGVTGDIAGSSVGGGRVAHGCESGLGGDALVLESAPVPAAARAVSCPCIPLLVAALAIDETSNECRRLTANPWCVTSPSRVLENSPPLPKRPPASMARSSPPSSRRRICGAPPPSHHRATAPRGTSPHRASARRC